MENRKASIERLHFNEYIWFLKAIRTLLVLYSILQEQNYNFCTRNILQILVTKLYNLLLTSIYNLY